MIKQVSKHFSYDVSFKKNLLYSLTYRDFLIFRRKFFGIFIFKGKKAFSVKMFNYIFLSLKKMRRKYNPNKLFFIISKRISPFLTTKETKIGKRIVAVPSFFYGNKKNVLLLRWMVRLLRNKSNIFGIKKEDVLKNLFDLYNFRGPIFKFKEEHNKKVRQARINFKNEGVEVSNFAMRKLNKDEYIQAKFDYWWKEIDRLNADLDFSDSEISDEVERWYSVERDYKYVKKFKSSVRRLSHKNKDFLRYYKKLFVK